MEVAHIDAFRRDPERFWRFYGQRFQTLEDKQPNGAHAALAELERARPARRGDHPEHRPAARAGRDARAWSRCTGRSRTRRVLSAVLRYELGDVRAPPGGGSGGGAAVRLRRAAEARRGAVRRVPARARRWRAPRRSPRGADLMLCIGSSLEVYPVARLPEHDAGRRRPDRDRHPGPDAVRPRAPRCGWAATWSTSSRRCSARSAADDPAPSLGWPEPRRARLSAASIRPERERRPPRARPRRQRPARAPPCGRRGDASRWPRSSARRSASAGAAGSGGSSASAASSATSTCSAASRSRPLVEVEPRAERQLLAGQRALAAGQQRGEPRLGAGASAARAGGAPGRVSSRASVHSPSATCSPAP